MLNTGNVTPKFKHMLHIHTHGKRSRSSLYQFFTDFWRENVEKKEDTCKIYKSMERTMKCSLDVAKTFTIKRHYCKKLFSKKTDGHKKRYTGQRQTNPDKPVMK